MIDAEPSVLAIGSVMVALKFAGWCLRTCPTHPDHQSRGIRNAFARTVVGGRA
jgi:hypothetical protein